MVKFIYYLLGLILSKYYRHNQVYRPTEIEAFRNIEREQRVVRSYGIKPYFTNFELKIYALDLHVRKVIIPGAIAANKTKVNSEKIPIPIHWLADKTSHTPEFIMKTLNIIDDKIYLREKYRIYPVLPNIKGFSF